jgi:hypothetical protein
MNLDIWAMLTSRHTFPYSSARRFHFLLVYLKRMHHKTPSLKPRTGGDIKNVGHMNLYLTSHIFSRLKSASQFKRNLRGGAKNVFSRKTHDNGTESEDRIETTENNMPHKLTEMLRWCGKIFTHCMLYYRSVNRMMEYGLSGQGSSPDTKRNLLLPPCPEGLWPHLHSYILHIWALSHKLKMTWTWNWPFIYESAVLKNARSFGCTVLLLLNVVLLNCSHYCNTFK